MEINLVGKTAFVTGGNIGIGRGVSLALARCGADVALTYFSHSEEGEATVSASAVKSYASEAFTHNAGSAIQVLGGTGFTLESEVHLYLKRAKANEMAFGDPAYHRERVVQLLATNNI